MKKICIMMSLLIGCIYTFGYAASPLKIDLDKEIPFWAARFADHTEYLSVLSTDANLKKRALNLHNKFNDFVQNTSYFNHLSGALINDYKKLLDELNDLQNDMVTFVKKGSYKVAGALLNHMKEEFNRHDAIVNLNVPSLEQEKQFWSNHDKEVDELEDALKNQKLSKQEKAVFDKLVAMGLKAHETKEDKYAASLQKGDEK